LIERINWIPDLCASHEPSCPIMRFPPRIGIAETETKGYSLRRIVSRQRKSPLDFEIFEPTMRQVFKAQRAPARMETYLLMCTRCQHFVITPICDTCPGYQARSDLLGLREMVQKSP
jgi:hypothetical protein